MSVKQVILGRLNSIEREGMDDLIKFLNKSDYFLAPASVRGHCNYPYGLAIHSHNVVELMIEKNKRYHLGLTLESIYLAGYLHDLCKVNIFKPVLKLRYNQKNEKECYFTYDCVDEFPLGHGEKSVIIAQQYLRLTLEEILLIRWHTGPDTPCENTFRYDQALKSCPAIKAIFTADEEAATFLEKIKEPQVYQPSVYYAWKKTGILPKNLLH